jgi:hypothetical protein
MTPADILRQGREAESEWRQLSTVFAAHAERIVNEWLNTGVDDWKHREALFMEARGLANVKMTLMERINAARLEEQIAEGTVSRFERR